MIYYYYKIKSPAVIALLEGNRTKRKAGLKAAFEFAEKYGRFEIGSANDGLFEDIDIAVVSVPEEWRKHFKRMPRGNWLPKKNSKVGREFDEKISALRIELDSPFKLVEEETGFVADIVFDLATRCVGHPNVFPVGKVYFLRIPSLSDKPPIDSCENYEPVEEWEVQKLINENNKNERARQ